jgi:hypothetical protein
MGTIISFVVYAFVTLTTVFSPVTGHVTATTTANTGAGLSVTQVVTGNTIVTSAL